MMHFMKRFAPSIAFLLTVFLLLGMFAVLPKSTFSENEKRVLASPPAFSFDALFDGSFAKELEAYLSDHFPLRDAFVGINAYYELATGRGGASDIYYGKDGYLIAAPAAGSTDTVAANVSRYAAFAEKTGLPASLMIVPSTGYILSEKLPAVHGTYADDTLFEAAIGSLGNMELIDLREPFLQCKDNTQLYYKTDHHLTSAGAFEMYKQFAAQQDLAVIDSYRVETASDFYGTAYSRSGYWLSEPDNIELWHLDGLQPKIEIIEAGSDPIISDSLFFEDRLEEADKYPVFLDGNHSLVKITNEAADGGKLLLVKDSFAHCFTGFLVPHYSEIYMVDLRYYRQSVSQLVKDNSIDELLYLYGVDNLSAESANSAWLE